MSNDNPTTLENQVLTLIEKVTELNNKIDRMETSLNQQQDYKDVKRQIQEIHKLHFAKEHLEKKSLRDKFLAEILLSKPRKPRKKS